MVNISLAGETIFYIGPLAVTSTLLTTWLVMLFLFIGSKLALSSYGKVPTRVQVALEVIIGGLYDTFKSILGKKVNRSFPLLASLFLFIIVSNWSELLPGVGTIGVRKQSTVQQEIEEPNRPFDIPLFRAPTADLNTTFALSVISMAMLQFWGIQALGSLNYLRKFITFKNPISFFVGILELISEVGKIISFAFRLFGNIFAGEVLLIITGSLIPFLMPIPFLGLEIFVGFIQALVFSMLLAVFLSIATTKAHD